LTSALDNDDRITKQLLSFRYHLSRAARKVVSLLASVQTFVGSLIITQELHASCLGDNTNIDIRTRTEIIEDTRLDGFIYQLYRLLLIHIVAIFRLKDRHCCQ